MSISAAAAWTPSLQNIRFGGATLLNSAWTHMKDPVGTAKKAYHFGVGFIKNLPSHVVSLVSAIKSHPKIAGATVLVSAAAAFLYTKKDTIKEAVLSVYNKGMGKSAGEPEKQASEPEATNKPVAEKTTE